MALDAGLQDFIAWLEKRHDAVFLEEKTAKELLAKGDTDGYAAHMHAKAELLAKMAVDAGSSLAQVSGDVQEEIRRKLVKFSAAAAYGLRINSLFFMSALLYRDEHPLGEPDNLLVFINDLKAMNAGEGG